MTKRNIGNTRVGISPSVIVGALVNGKENYITLGQCSGLSMNPPMMYISINKAHYTNDGIKENGYFSVNIPSENMVIETDYAGIVSGKKTDKSELFEVFHGQVKNAPMIKECPLNMECRLYDVYPTIFIGPSIASPVD